MNTYYGEIALVGRPNVGKSTLLNALLAHNTSIVTAKPHTTRSTIRGILTVDDKQAVFIDTPGMNQHAKRLLNRAMNRAVSQSIQSADCVVWLVTCDQWGTPEQWLLEHLSEQQPVFLLINKIDQLKNQDALYPFIEQLKSKFNFLEIIPLSAKKGIQVETIKDLLLAQLPKGPHRHTLDSTPETLHLAELIRQPIIEKLRDELPYISQVVIDKQEERPKLITLHASIWVERPSQKKILIGKQGSQLKSIGIQARQALEKELGKQVMLKLWVKVKKDWLDQAEHLPGDLH